MRKKDKPWVRDMVLQRVERLFSLAASEFRAHPGLSNRYAFLARRLSMRHRVRLPAEFRRHMCRHCGSYLVHGANTRVRLSGSYVTVTCLECGGRMRYPYRS